MPTTICEQAVPRWFRLRTVALSHGWYDLPPFAWAEESGALSFACRLEGRVVHAAVAQQPRHSLSATLTYAGREKKGMVDAFAPVLTRMLGFGGNYASFYRLAGREFSWAKRIGAGPLLRAPTVFEDVVKMLATTNCSWALTSQMIRRLVDAIGDPSPAGTKAFPSPAAMAGESVAFYRDTVRAGYRAPYFKEIADRVARGSVDLESWCDFAGTTKELAKEIRELPGLGPYAAENVCKLLGRYDGLGLDSWCLKKFPEIHGPVRGDVARAIGRHYDRFGSWRGLALWLDLTKSWHAPGSMPGL